MLKRNIPQVISTSNLLRRVSLNHAPSFTLLLNPVEFISNWFRLNINFNLNHQNIWVTFSTMNPLLNYKGMLVDLPFPIILN